ncbi:MAG: hypothetical protein JJ975_08105 [Bacteroidia bacterium]|nr:hypothetical protein [Bacteroidia bacterium]
MACNDGASGNFAPIIELQEIELVKNDTGRDSLLFIHFTYEDKDGNLGLSDSDTSGAFRGANNLMINFREKNNGVYTPLLNRISGLPANFNQRIPNLTPTGKNKEISGTISVSFGVDPNEIYADTIAFDLYIEDRSFNQSNVIEATDVVLVQ